MFGIKKGKHLSITGLVGVYIVAIDVTRVRFPADAVSKGDAKSPDDFYPTFFFFKKASLLQEHHLKDANNTPRPGIEPGSSA